WQFYAIEGLSEGRGALFVKMHHTITDGKGGIRLAERYMEIARDTAPPPDVDLDKIVADAAADADGQRGRNEKSSGIGALGLSIGRVAGHGLRRQLGMARRIAGEATLVANDPGRVV